MDLELRGKNVLVTGASKGIGLACARAFAAEGCNLHIAARSAAELEKNAAELSAQYKVKVTPHAYDLAVSENTVKLARECGPLDVLVNNAGAIPGGHLADIDEARWRKAWELKVFGYINLTREVYADMRARGSGVIVNVIGLAGERNRPEYIAGTAGTRRETSWPGPMSTWRLPWRSWRRCHTAVPSSCFSSPVPWDLPSWIRPSVL